MPAVDKDALQDLSSVTPDVQEMSLKDIFDNVCINEDIIIVIDAVEETRVRKGLSSIKAKQNAKLKDSDLPTDDSTLEFARIMDDALPKEHIKLRIYMKRKPTVTVRSFIVADGEL